MGFNLGNLLGGSKPPPAPATVVESATTALGTITRLADPSTPNVVSMRTATSLTQPLLTALQGLDHLIANPSAARDAGIDAGTLHLAHRDLRNALHRARDFMGTVDARNGAFAPETAAPHLDEASTSLGTAIRLLGGPVPPPRP